MEPSMLCGAAFLVVGALVLIIEVHNLTVYLLAVALGLFASSGMAFAGFSLTIDLIVLAIVIILGLPGAYWWRGKLKNRAAEDISNDDSGRTVTVVSIAGQALRVRYRGTIWDGRLATNDMPAVVGSDYTIVRRDGNLLILSP
jgi:membrane protein implicated in regulation of membrane protease activity